VRGRVDPPREPAHDGNARTRQAGRQVTRDRDSATSRGPGPHDGHHRQELGEPIALHVQTDRRRVDLPEDARILSIPWDDETSADGPDAFELMFVRAGSESLAERVHGARTPRP